MAKLYLLPVLPLVAIGLLTSSASAGILEPVLEEEHRIAYIGKILNLEPRKTFSFNGQPFAEGEVPGDGSCIIHTLRVLFPEKDITREKFVRLVKEALSGGNPKVSSDGVRDELSHELYLQLAQYCLQYDQKQEIEFKGESIDKLARELKGNFDPDHESAILARIKSSDDILQDIIKSLSNEKAMLSLAYQGSRRLGTFGLACQLFELNLAVFTQVGHTDNIELRMPFEFGGNSTPKEALFSTRGAHVSPLCDINDASMRQAFARESLRMLHEGYGVYQTFGQTMRDQLLNTPWQDLQNGRVRLPQDPYVNEVRKVSLVKTGVPNQLAYKTDNTIEVQTDISTYSYQVMSEGIDVKGFQTIQISYSVNLKEGGFGIGLLTGDQSTWLTHKSFSGASHINDTFEIPVGSQEKMVLVFDNNANPAAVSKFDIQKYEINVIKPNTTSAFRPLADILREIRVSEIVMALRSTIGSQNPQVFLTEREQFARLVMNGEDQTNLLSAIAIVRSEMGLN